MSTNNTNNDTTRLYNADDSTVLNNDATVLNTSPVPENARPDAQEETTGAQAPTAKRAKKNNTGINGSHVAAAGVGAVAGAAAMSAVTASADVHPSTLDLEQAGQNAEGGFDTIAKDVTDAAQVSTDDKPTEITIDPVTGEQATVVQPDGININININNGTASVTPADGTNTPLDVHGPNPTEAVHRAANQLHHDKDLEPTHEQPSAVHEPAHTPDPEPYHMSEPMTVNGATGVNDSMSFSQAFAAARAEVGPGGSFTWHGQVYGTYYENEWNAMTPQEQNQFTMAAIHGETHEANNFEEPLYAAKPIEVEPYDANEYVDQYDDEVHVIAMGEVEGDDGTYQMAALDVNGQTAVVIDTDQDMIYDVMHVDLDMNNEVSPDELVDISAGGLTVDDVAAQAAYQEMQDQSFDIAGDNMADFDNNVDISSFDA